MTTTERLRGELAALEQQAAELEAQAATADAAELPQVGGMLAGLAVKLKGARGKLADALSQEAAKERERKARAEAEARAELLERIDAEQKLWLAWLHDVDELDARAGELWQQYRAMRDANGRLVTELIKRDMLGELGGRSTFGSLTGAARAWRDGTGNLRSRSGQW